MTDPNDTDLFDLCCESPDYGVVSAAGKSCGIENALDTVWVKITPQPGTVIVSGQCLRCKERVLYFSWDFVFEETGRVLRLRLGQCKKCKKVFWYCESR